MDRKWNSETIKQLIEPYGYTYIEKFKDDKGRTKVRSLCPNNNLYEFAIPKFAQGKRCKCEDCTGRVSWTNERIQKMLDADNATLISVTKNSHYDKFVTIRCKSKNVNTYGLNGLKKMNWKCPCTDCGGRRKYTEEYIIDVVENAGYQFKGYYKDDTNHLRVNVVCPNGHEYATSFYHFIVGFRCDKCRPKSKGEYILEKVLTDNGCNFLHEYTFDDCVNKNKLKFDFAVFDGEQIKCLIEYDGIAHYEPTRFHGIDKSIAEENFAKQKERDLIKDKYCEKNNIPLIRIPYTIKGERAISGYLTIKSRGIGIRLW